MSGTGLALDDRDLVLGADVLGCDPHAARGVALVRDAHPSTPPAAPPRAASSSEADLWRLVHVEAQADRQLARGLALLWEKDLCRPLGYVRVTDFVREHLGIEEGRARWLAKLGKGLQLIPEFDQAFAQGRIHGSKVIDLMRVVSTATPAAERLAWIERARGKTVRALRKEVRAELKKQEAASPEAGNAAGVEEARAPRIITLDDVELPEGGWMSFPVPARVGVLWHEAFELVQAAAGRHLTPGEGAELIFAEYLSAFNHEEEEESAESPDDERSRRLAIVMEALNQEHTMRHARPALPEVAGGEEALSAAARLALSAPPPEIAFPEGCAVDDDQDPWELAETLIRLSDLKKPLRHDIAVLLARVRETVAWHALGFRSFEEYCEERLGFGLRQAEKLMQFRAGLARFPRLKRAYLEGGVSYTAALLLLPILHPLTEEAWVTWADGITYRELERVAEFARTFALPEACPSVFEQWVRGLVEQGFARKGNGDAAGANVFAVEAEASSAEAVEANAFAAEPTAAQANAFATGEAPADGIQLARLGYPLGCALPPSRPGAPPLISGLPEDITLTDPERCVARVRFWLPKDALDLAHRALNRCRRRLPDPLLPTWVYFEIILVHFCLSLDTPEAREFKRRHPILVRDGFLCLIPGCTSRARLDSHHFRYRGKQGSNKGWNRGAICRGHHVPGEHEGILKIGGWAPHDLTTRLGINPRTGRALVCFHNERRIPEEEAEAALEAWRQWWRDRKKRERKEK